MTVTLSSDELTGGVPVLIGGAPGAQVQQAGQVQYGAMLLGTGTPAGWVTLHGWRDTPDAQAADSLRPQAHGAYPGDVYGDSLVVTFTYLLRGSVVDKQNAVDTIEAHTPLDGVERALVVNDGSGPWLRWGRVIARQVPQEKHYQHGPLECSIQFLCADPRRYARDARTALVALPTSVGGLGYPLAYPLDYGASTAGGAQVENRGSVPTPPTVTFVGPLTDPVLTSGSWRLGFDLTLADGETLTVDTSAGTALLNGNADRLYTIRNDSDPLERCLLAPGDTSLTLIAAAGTGHVTLSFRDARM